MSVLPIPSTEVAQSNKDARYQFTSTYVADLRSVIGYYIGYIPSEQADSSETFFETIHNDCAVKHASHLLSIMTAGENVKVWGENKDLNKIVAKALGYVSDFTHVRKALVENSVMYGLGVMKKYYRDVTWREFGDMRFSVPYSIQEVDRRRMRIERGLSDKTETYWTIWSPKFDRYMEIEDRARIPNAALAVQDFIWAVHEHEEDMPYYYGLGAVLYQICWTKSKVMQYWADLAEHWGEPIIKALIDTAMGTVNAAIGDGYATYQERATALLSVLDKMRKAHVIALPKAGQEVDIMEHGTSGSNILRELIEYIDKRIQLLLLGAELTTSSPGEGSYALGQIHRGATQSIVQFNRLRLQEVLERDLVYDFIYRNRANFKKLGLWPIDPKDVRLEITVEAEQIEKKKALEQGPGGSPEQNPLGEAQ